MVRLEPPRRDERVRLWCHIAPTGTPESAEEPAMTSEEELDPDLTPSMPPGGRDSECTRVAKFLAVVMQAWAHSAQRPPRSS